MALNDHNRITAKSSGDKEITIGTFTDIEGAHKNHTPDMSVVNSQPIKKDYSNYSGGSWHRGKSGKSVTTGRGLITSTFYKTCR